MADRHDEKARELLMQIVSATLSPRRRADEAIVAAALRQEAADAAAEERKKNGDLYLIEREAVSRVLQSHEAFVGACVVWMHVPRGGYGYAYPIDAKVVALSLDGTQATIEVSRKTGERVRRRVHTKSLRWRDRLRDATCAFCSEGGATAESAVADEGSEGR